MLAHDLELRVDVERHEEQACPTRSRMSRREGLQGVIDLVTVACAYRAVVHDALKPNARDGARIDVGLADGVEVRAKTTNKPFKEHLLRMSI